MFQISWFKRELDGRVILLAVGDETYIADSRFAVFRPVLSMVGLVGFFSFLI